MNTKEKLALLKMDLDAWKEAESDEFLPERVIDSAIDKLTTRIKQMEKELIAKVCHEVNRAYCLALGDNSQPFWDDAPKWQKDSAMLGVELHTENPDAGPEASHTSWMAQKLVDGWKYGPEKNPELKEHPCIVPFHELPTEQQAKDFIFKAVVEVLSNID